MINSDSKLSSSPVKGLDPSMEGLRALGSYPSLAEDAPTTPFLPSQSHFSSCEKDGGLWG